MRGDGCQGAPWPQQSGAVDIRWVDAAGKRVLDDRPLVEGFLKGFTPTVPLDYASDEQSSGGWTRVSAIHQAPGGAKIAEVRMHLRWAAKARAEWSEVVFREVEAPAPRKVRLATVHFRPTGKTPEENREQFAPLIAEAARQKADLVVLPETLTYYGTGKPMVEMRRAGPRAVDRLLRPARASKHDLYIVAGLLERDGHLVYNVAVLHRPGRQARRQVSQGLAAARRGRSRALTPGREYPVFDTRFGKLGMMVCYDGFFPEVARELTNRGAEVIAWPVWGCNPHAGPARAPARTTSTSSAARTKTSRATGCSPPSTTTTGRADRPGEGLGHGRRRRGRSERRTRWPSLGDFRSKLQRHAPMTPAAARFE